MQCLAWKRGIADQPRLLGTILSRSPPPPYFFVLFYSPEHSGGDESLFGCSWAAIVAALEQGTAPPPSLVSSPSHGEAVQGALRVQCPQRVAGTRTRRPEINSISYDEVCVCVCLCARQREKGCFSE